MSYNPAIKIAIRVDASMQIGTGHIIRCLTIAEALRCKGGKVVFVCRAHVGHLCSLIESNGFEVLKLGLDREFSKDNPVKIEQVINQDQLVHADWLGVDQQTDAAQTIAVLEKDSHWDWVIVDHYAIDACWESAMRSVAKKIMVIDDLADRQHDCDLLLDQNYFQEPAKRYDGLLPDYSNTLLGPKFAIIRPEFRQARKFSRMRGNGIARVFVYFGGNDPNNLTGMTLEALSSRELCYLFVEAVVGTNNQFFGKLEKQVHKRPGTRLHNQPEGFVELMLRADICIGAGGTTTWERLCMGLPSLVITVAKNQESFTEELHKAGYIRWIGQGENITENQILDHLKKNIRNPYNIDVNSLQNLVDGEGTVRVTEEIMRF